MDPQPSSHTPARAYSIKEAAQITGLSPSTLRYYEEVRVGPSIKRDESSGHRVYSEEDVELLGWIACLAATGMGIAEMREYFANGKSGQLNPEEQIKLLRAHNEELLQEQRILRQRRKYLTLKIQYWEAVAAGDNELAADLARQSLEVTKTFR